MNGRVYYNEFEPRTAAWLRQLIADGHLPAGDVDERSIEDVVPSDLHGYRQCHFFAGIGGWAYALALAGWPDDRPVWTGSCPCQPFSSAGARAGFADERHLWPAWQHLIAQCRPPRIFGEQVAGKAVGPWIDLVQADLEGMGYAFGCMPIPAAGIGAPEISDRLFWMAAADRDGFGATSRDRLRNGEHHAEPCSRLGGVASPDGTGLQERERISGVPSGARRDDSRETAQRGSVRPAIPESGTSPTDGFWRAADWLFCRDGLWRPVEPGTFPLAHGLPARVVRLRGYGNAIVPQVAAEFIRAAVEAWEPLT